MITKKKSVKEIANDKSERIMNGIACWASFYRSNPQRFVKDYLNVTLKLFQEILLYEMMHNNHVIYIAARGQGKTWLTALFCVIRCILYPKTKICICSSTRGQANEVLSKIEDDFMKNYGWGSDNLKREITFCTINANKAVIEFANGSWIKVVTASDSGRGSRANVVIVDEYRMVDKNIADTVIKRFLAAPRQPNYLNNPEYANLQERNKEIYMSSAWYQDSWAFEKFKAYVANMLDDKKRYFVCSIPYQVSVMEGLLSKEQIQDEMSENDFDDMKFSMEMGSLFWGDTGAFFSFDDINKRRRLKFPMYPSSVVGEKSRLFKIPDLALNERRILSVDVALMASKTHKNDASAIMINSAVPTSNNTYVANIVYMENHEGLNTDELALVVRKLYDEFKCTELVIDSLGSGLGVFDALIRDIVDPETGVRYPALSCFNDNAMAERCKVPNAPKVIWAIKGNAGFNSEICVLLRNGFKQGKINLLISDADAEEVLKEKIKTFGKMQVYEQVQYELPYVNTTLLVNELVKLEHENRGNNIKIKERYGMRKDRYSSLAYNYYVQCQLEREILQKPQSTLTISDYAKNMKKISWGPTRY